MKGVMILTGAAALLLAASAQAQTTSASGTASGALSPPSTATPPTNPAPASAAAVSGTADDAVGANTNPDAGRVTRPVSGDASAAALNDRPGYDARTKTRKTKARKGPAHGAPTAPR